MTPVLAKRLGADRNFERLYRKHAGDVYRYALVVLRNQADAEDVTQTTFLNAYRAMEKQLSGQAATRQAALLSIGMIAALLVTALIAGYAIFAIFGQLLDTTGSINTLNNGS